MVAIIDYGVGNLFSLSSSLSFLNIENEVTGDEKKIAAASHIILPGVGAFGDAMEKLKSSGLDTVLRQQAKKGRYILGICLGMQLLFEESFEYGRHKGLGLISGKICSLAEDFSQADISLKIPHIGWNSLQIEKPENPLTKAIGQNSYVYYVHSFYAKYCQQSVAATSCYGVSIPGIVSENSVFGCQFHPEKSGESGLAILKAFCTLG